MKKNPLSEIYESKVLTSESVPSNKVKGEKELDSKIDAKKAHLVPGQGPDAVKKDLDTPEEMEGTKVHHGEPAVLKDSIDMKTPKKPFEGSFEKLFKATINEQFPGEEEMNSPEMEMEMDVEVPTTSDEMADEIEGEKDEVSDLVSDLKSVMDHLQNILDKISEETNDNESESSEEAEAEFNDEEGIEELEDEEPVREATELKPLGDKGKVLMSKNNKVGGTLKAHSGKAHTGNIESDPELKPAKSFDKSLQNVKGKPEVKSTVKKGEFFK
jgi:hypothetical protein